MLPPRNQIGVFGIAVLLLGGMAFLGAQRLKQPAAITYEPSATPTSNPTLTVATEVVVHVVGGVKNPGVIHAKPSDRVEDAIRMAGGASEDADLDSINLAAKLEDGVQLVVPTKVPILESAPSLPPEAMPPSTPEVVKSAAVPVRTPKQTSKVVHLNTATLSDLDRLPGVGPSTAQKISDYRREHGGFSSIEEVMSVKGIGPKKFAAMRPFLAL